MLERSLVALGRHATTADGRYWVVAIAVVGIGVGLGITTGLWGLFGVIAGLFSIVAYYARTRYEKSQGK